MPIEQLATILGKAAHRSANGHAQADEILDLRRTDRTVGDDTRPK